MKRFIISSSLGCILVSWGHAVVQCNNEEFPYHLSDICYPSLAYILVWKVSIGMPRLDKAPLSPVHHCYPSFSLSVSTRMAPMFWRWQWWTTMSRWPRCSSRLVPLRAMQVRSCTAFTFNIIAQTGRLLVLIITIEAIINTIPLSHPKPRNNHHNANTNAISLHHYYRSHCQSRSF